MICPFCYSELKPKSNFRFICTCHNITTSFFFSSSVAQPQLYLMSYNIDNKEHIYFSLSKKCTIIFKYHKEMHSPYDTQLYSSDSLIPILPKDAREFINKIKSLKSFT